MSSRKRPVTVRVARWSATHPWSAISLWIAFVFACVALGSLAGLREMSDTDGTTGQSHTAAQWLHDASLESPDTETVLVTAPSGRLDTRSATRIATDAGAKLRVLPQVTGVAKAIVSPDRSAVAVQVTLANDADVAPLQDVTQAVAEEHPNLHVEQVGSVSMNDAVNDQVASDLSAVTEYSLPVTIVIMLIAFGAIVAAGVPILLALSAVGAATGLASLASHLLPDSGSTSSMILLMGMAVGVDYSLFYVKRARAERHAGRSQLDAVEIAAETSGHSVLVSGVAVIVSMLGLFVTSDAVFSSLAAGSIIVVAVAVLGSLTVLPAVLVKLGKRIDRPRVPVLWRWTMSDREPRLWTALLRPSLRRPGRTLVISVVALGAVALPALGMRLSSDSAKSLPSSIAEKHTLDRLTAAFPGENTTYEVVVRTPAASGEAAGEALAGLAQRLRPDRLFVAGSGNIDASADGTVHVLRLDAPVDPESDGARAGVAELRALTPDAVAGIAGAQWAVGGESARNLDTDNHLADRLPWVIAFVILLTMVIMGWVFRSAVLAVLTAAVNLLSAGAAFGVLVLVFQNSWANGLLGFESTGALINWIPLFTFAVLFGLSMDYHVFVLSSIREAAARGVPLHDAVPVGITRSAGTVTSAALVMVSVFAIFASLHMVEMKELGLGLAVAVLVDALVVRGVVLPSLLVLLGRRIWWPSRGPAVPTAPPRELVAIG
jgi:putative drug exporter of the RND superfamily